MFFRQGESDTTDRKEKKKHTWPNGQGKCSISETVWPNIKHINTKTHKHKATISKKVVETYLWEKCIKSYYIMVVIVFLMFILSGLFFVRITRITEKKKKKKSV